MIEQMGFSATVLRPAYFMSNDVTIKDVAMIDARDVGEIAAIELIRREKAAGKLPLERINLVDFASEIAASAC